MTNKQKLLAAACGVALSAAGIFFGYQHFTKEPETVFVDVETLRPSSIYNAEAVYWYNQNHKNDNAEMAASYLKKAEELEAQNLHKAIYNAKRAVTLQPSAEHYRYLASLLNKAGQYRELEQVYTLLAMENYVDTDGLTDQHHGNKDIYLFGQPDEDTFYEYLAASFLAYNFLEPGFTSYAEEMGFSISSLKKRFLADNRIKLVPGTNAYKELMLALMTDEEIEAYMQSEENFRNLLASIKDSASMFTIGEKEVQEFDYRTLEEGEGTLEVSDFFVHYLEEKQQNPNQWYSFNVTHKIRLSDSVRAVVYAIDTSMVGCPATMRHIYHKLVTYNKKGRIIQSKVVALQAGEQLSTLQYSGNSFTVTDHKRNWKKPYNKNDFDNYLVKTEAIGSRNYVITGNGKIAEQVVSASEEPATISEI